MSGPLSRHATIYIPCKPLLNCQHSKDKKRLWWLISTSTFFFYSSNQSEMNPSLILMGAHMDPCAAPCGLPGPHFWKLVCYRAIRLVLNKVFPWHDQVEITEKKSTCALARAPTEAPLLHRHCSSSFPPRAWKVSYAEVTKRLQAPATVDALFFSPRLAGGVVTAGRIIRCAWIYNLE